MSDCPACDRAATNPVCGIYQSGCMPCTARDIANGPEAKARERDPAALQARLRKAWPEQSDYQKGRALVWEAIKRREALLDEARAKVAASGAVSLSELVERFGDWPAPEVSGKQPRTAP